MQILVGSHIRLMPQNLKEISWHFDFYNGTVNLVVFKVALDSFLMFPTFKYVMPYKMKGEGDYSEKFIPSI